MKYLNFKEGSIEVNIEKGSNYLIVKCKKTVVQMENKKKEIKNDESHLWDCNHHNEIKNCKSECYIQTLLSLFGKKHSMGIIRLLLLSDKLRFNEILNRIGGSPKTITERLKELVKHGLISRKSYNEVPIRVEYSLTEHGRSLEDMFKGISIWASNIMEKTKGKENHKLKQFME